MAEKGREKQKETLGGYKHTSSVLSSSDKTESHDTRKELAESEQLEAIERERARERQEAGNNQYRVKETFPEMSRFGK